MMIGTMACDEHAARMRAASERFVRQHRGLLEALARDERADLAHKRWASWWADGYDPPDDHKVSLSP